MAEQNNQTVEDIITGGSDVQRDLESSLSAVDLGMEQLVKRAESGEAFNLAELTARTSFLDKTGKNFQGDLDELRRLRDAESLSDDLRIARMKGSDEDKLKAAQESLRLKEFERALGDQLEAGQLAQRTIAREQQSLRRQQATFESGAQQAAASIQNRAAQTGLSNASATQGMIASINTQRAVGVSDFGVQQSDLSSDAIRLATNLTNDLQFLNESFDLGGDISAAAQSISNRQAREAQRAQQKAEASALGGSIGSAAGFAIGGPIGGAIGGTLGSIGGSLFG
jgi:hypothetical protein